MSQPNGFIIKFIALLSIVRWYNILIVSIALLFSAVFLLNNIQDYIIVLKDYRLYTAIVSLAFIMKAGFIINAFYDFEKDIINRPNETIFGRVISKSTCLNVYVLFIFAGLFFAAITSFYVFIFNFLMSFSLWFYSHKLRKKAFTAEISAAILTVAPFFSLVVYYGNYNIITMVYVGYIFVLTLTREIIKKMISLKGDLIVGEKSLPIILGIKKTKYIILFWILIGSICIATLLNQIIDLPIFFYFLVAQLSLFFAILYLKKCKTAQHFTYLNNLFKMLLISAILSIPLVYKWF